MTNAKQCAPPPDMPLREKIFFRMICETTSDVLEARIELWTGNTSEMLRHRAVTGNFTIKRGIPYERTYTLENTRDYHDHKLISDGTCLGNVTNMNIPNQEEMS